MELVMTSFCKLLWKLVIGQLLLLKIVIGDWASENFSSVIDNWESVYLSIKTKVVSHWENVVIDDWSLRTLVICDWSLGTVVIGHLVKRWPVITSQENDDWSFETKVTDPQWTMNKWFLK